MPPNIVNSKAHPFVLIVTGPCGAGKTTVCKLIADQEDATCIAGDAIKEELFPEIACITDYPDKLEEVKNALFQRTKTCFDRGKNVVVDYIVLGQEQYDKYRSAFMDRLTVRILLPDRIRNLERDASRGCWTAGEECVLGLYDQFQEFKHVFDPECFVDNTDETPEETYRKHFKTLFE